jgi:MoxR-like ATPase
VENMTKLSIIQKLQQRLRHSIVGRDDVIDLVIIALLADGHVLLEDYPGSGKTTLAKSLGNSIVPDNPKIKPMRRVQFTPDLLPSDVTGTTIFDPQERKFHFRSGPIFCHVLLADEINRTSPKVQAALLEAMAEKQTTIDNNTYQLDELFFVIATQNPLDLAGTYPLPSAQLDRFLFKIKMTHISKSSELDLLMRLDSVIGNVPVELPLVTRKEILELRDKLKSDVYVAPEIKEALVNFADETRESNLSLQGISTRSLVLAIPALKAHAWLNQRDYVTPEDLVTLAPYIFAHRLMMAPGSNTAEELVEHALQRPLELLSKKSLRR